MPTAIDTAESVLSHFGSQEPDIVNRCYECLETIGTTINVPKNFRLYNAGALPDRCYLIKEGRVISFEYTYSGRQHVFSNTGNNEPDSLILLPAVILGHRLTLSFMTTTASKLVCIQRDELIKAISEYDELAIGISYILSAKFVGVNERFRIESNKAVSWKLCNLLLSLAGKYGVEYDGKVLIKQKCSQQMMADYLHVNRTTVARCIKELADSALIERINDYYCIRSVDKLRSHMDASNGNE